MSLSSPASWAAEMNFQSRYPGGILVTMICLASLLASVVAFPEVMPVLFCPNDDGVIHATTPARVTAATNTKAIRFIVPSLGALEHIPGIPDSEYPLTSRPGQETRGRVVPRPGGRLTGIQCHPSWLFGALSSGRSFDPSRRLRALLCQDLVHELDADGTLADGRGNALGASRAHVS